MSFNLWERLKWFHLFIYLISWHSNLTFSFRGALYKDNRGPSKNSIGTCRNKKFIYRGAAWHFAWSLGCISQESGEFGVLTGERVTTPGLFSEIRHCWPALSNSENLAIICQTKEQRGRESEGILLVVQLWCQLICNNVTVAGGQGWGREIRRQADGGQTALILLLSNETISEPNFYQQDVSV